LADIKIKPKNSIKIRKFDKANIYTQNFKNNIINVKNKIEYDYDNTNSPNENVINNITQKMKSATSVGIDTINRYGKKSTKLMYQKGIETIKTKDEKINKVSNHIPNQIKENTNIRMIKYTSEKNNSLKLYNSKKDLFKPTEERKRNYHISKVQKKHNLKQLSLNTKRIINNIKNIASKINYLLVLGVASVWIFILIILILCIIGAFTLYNDIPPNAGNDIVLVAKSQVGNVGGIPFWSWYGFNTRVEWCACFVSWCANQCNLIENGILPKFAGCQSEGIPWFKERNLWQKGNYIPKAGDIIFFDWENDGISDHVGIVEKCEENIVYTIEGNSNDMCREKTYQIDSTDIIGYGTPIY